jgi:triosephosphate isomerase (TIM)
MHKKYLYVANWKAFLPYHQAIIWWKKHSLELKELSEYGNIIICPDFLTIPELQKTIAPIGLGAQNCSMKPAGSFTGEISAQSLKEVGVQYCIVGHNERRKLFEETPAIIEQKIKMLLQHNITPIICVSDEWEKELKTDDKIISLPGTYLIIAYEPISAIGTGNAASPEKVEKVLQNIHEHIKKQMPEVTIKLLYGGSVNASNSVILKNVSILDGFLMGRSSMNFQELKTIITE